MTKHEHRDGKGQFTPVPEADTSVADLSGNPVGEHARPADATVYPSRRHGSGQPGIIPQRQAVMLDGSRHDYGPEARGLDSLYNGGHLRSQVLAEAAQGDPLLTYLVSDQRGPDARSRGREAYLSALKRTGHEFRYAQDDGGHP